MTYSVIRHIYDGYDFFEWEIDMFKTLEEAENCVKQWENENDFWNGIRYIIEENKNEC